MPNIPIQASRPAFIAWAEGKKNVLFACLLIAVVFAVFMPSLGNRFINWDDFAYVVDNPDIKAPSARNIHKIFTSFYVSNYHPLTLLSYMGDYAVWRLNPFGYHLTSLLLHLANCLLVFWLCRLIGARCAVAFITALLFGIHPMRVESVAWVAERKDVLYAFFYLGALISYVFYLVRERKVVFLRLTLILFFLALLSKTMAVTLPVMLFCFDYLLRRRPDRYMFLEKIPFFLLSVVFALLLLFSVYGTREEIALRAAADALPFGGPLWVFVFYLDKIFWPVHLSAYYPAGVLYQVALNARGYAWFFLFFSLLAFSLRRSRRLAFGCLFFIVCLLPLLQFFPHGDTKVADRFVYLASVGIFYVLAEGFFAAVCRCGLAAKRGLAIALLVVLGALSILTFQRCGVWKTSVSLWSDVLGQYPYVLVAHHNRGLAFINQGSLDQALGDSREIHKVLQGYEHLPFMGNQRIYDLNLRMLRCLSVGEFQEALRLVDEAIKIDPLARYKYDLNAAVAYVSLGQKEKATELLLKIIRNEPDMRAEAYYNLGIMAIYRRDFEEAEALFLQSLKADRDFAMAHNALAVFYHNRAELKKATFHYKRAVYPDAESAEVFNNVAVVLMDQGEYREAFSYARRAVLLEPQNVDALANLGAILCALDRQEEALRFLQKAQVLDPSSGYVQNNLCFAYYLARDCPQAALHCRRAQELKYPVADILWQKLDSCRP